MWPSSNSQLEIFDPFKQYLSKVSLSTLFCLSASVDQPLICMNTFIQTYTYTTRFIQVYTTIDLAFLLVHTLPDMTATGTHSCTFSEINSNSPVREQISFSSLWPLSSFLHCLLLTIDLCHSLLVLDSISHSVYSCFTTFLFLPAYLWVLLSITFTCDSLLMSACLFHSCYSFSLSSFPFTLYVFSLTLIL